MKPLIYTLLSAILALSVYAQRFPQPHIWLQNIHAVDTTANDSLAPDSILSQKRIENNMVISTNTSAAEF